MPVDFNSEVKLVNKDNIAIRTPEVLKDVGPVDPK